MTPTPDWATEALEALRESPSPSAQRLYKMAWVAALLGFILFILSFVLDVYYYERWTRLVQEYHDIHALSDISWLATISGYAHFIGTVLIVASIVLVIRGLLIDNNRRRAGTILIGTLKKLEWVAIIALMLYLLGLPISYFLWFVSENSYGFVYSYNAAYVFLAALPFIVAHALNKARA